MVENGITKVTANGTRTVRDAGLLSELRKLWVGKDAGKYWKENKGIFLR